MKDNLLLIIDMQNAYTEDGCWACEHIREAEANILRLLDNEECTERAEIVFTRFVSDENAVGSWRKYNEINAQVNEDEYANAITDKLKPYSDIYEIYDKSEYSSLSISQVREYAAETIDRGFVAVAGAVAECCVLSTVMGLIDMGVKVIYLKDAIAGVDDITEKAVLKVLSGLDPLHLECMTTEEYLSKYTTVN